MRLILHALIIFLSSSLLSGCGSDREEQALMSKKSTTSESMTALIPQSKRIQIAPGIEFQKSDNKTELIIGKNLDQQNLLLEKVYENLPFNQLKNKVGNSYEDIFEAISANNKIPIRTSKKALKLVEFQLTPKDRWKELNKMDLRTNFVSFYRINRGGDSSIDETVSYILIFHNFSEVLKRKLIFAIIGQLPSTAKLIQSCSFYQKIKQEKNCFWLYQELDHNIYF